MTIKKDLLTYNFTKGRSKSIEGIVMHSMWGYYEGSIAWFKNPEAKASAHYLISKDGEITQMVLDEDTAWHAGIIDEVAPAWVKPNPNWNTIGIELEDMRDSNWQYPEAQRKAANELVTHLMKKHNIKEDKIVMHKQLNPSRRSDPVGNFSYEWLLKEAIQSDKEAEIIADYEALTNKTPAQDTIEWRLIQGLSHKDRMVDMLENDSEFYLIWVQPEIDEALEGAEKACNTEKSKLDVEWQIKMESAKEKCDKEKQVLQDKLNTCKQDACESLEWWEHAEMAIKKLFGKLKPKGGE